MSAHRPKARLPKPLEHDVQESIVEALKLAGLRVWVTTAYLQKGPSGVDKGFPDLAVSLVSTPISLLIEVKRPGPIVASTFTSPEQREAFEGSAIVVARTPREALEHVRDWILVEDDAVVARAQAQRERVCRVLSGLSIEDGRNG